MVSGELYNQNIPEASDGAVVGIDRHFLEFRLALDLGHLCRRSKGNREAQIVFQEPFFGIVIRQKAVDSGDVVDVGKLFCVVFRLLISTRQGKNSIFCKFRLHFKIGSQGGIESIGVFIPQIQVQECLVGDVGVNYDHQRKDACHQIQQ